MALLDILRDRAGRKGGTAQVDCGDLGLLTVEALSPADCARLSGDSRALLYAACRELQRAGEQMRSEGGLFRPDEIMTCVTDAEADTAAQTILELSGAADANGPLSEIRLSPVQPFSEAIPEIRHQSVQSEGTRMGGPAAEEEIRPSSVQDSEGALTADGQDSREFHGRKYKFESLGTAEKKAQILGELSSRTAQILVPEKDQTHKNGFFAPRDKLDLHETESESRKILHEMKSELRREVHEIKSEVREMLYEIESELPEQAAQRLAEGLLRAVGVR